MAASVERDFPAEVFLEAGEGLVEPCFPVVLPGQPGQVVDFPVGGVEEEDPRFLPVVVAGELLEDFEGFPEVPPDPEMTQDEEGERGQERDPGQPQREGGGEVRQEELSDGEEDAED